MKISHQWFNLVLEPVCCNAAWQARCAYWHNSSTTALGEIMDLRTEILCHAWYCNPVQKLAGEAIGHMIETAIVILLNGHWLLTVFVRGASCCSG